MEAKDKSIDKIKISTKEVFKNKEHYETLDQFSRNVLYKIWENEPKQRDTWRGYEKFEVIDENYIKIHFTYGAGDMEYNGAYLVEITKDGFKTFNT